MNKNLQKKYCFVILFLLSSLFSVQYAIAATSSNINEVIQQRVSSRISIKVSATPIIDILDKLHKEHELGYVVSANINKELLTKQVTVDFENQTIETILNSILTKEGLSWKIENGKIDITKAPVAKQQQPEKITISGKVLDSAGEPVAGATLLVAGGSEGAITDAEGNYSINVYAGVTIEVSYIGMLTKNVVVNSENLNLIIRLEVDNLAVEDVVVTGVFQRNSNTYSGATRTVKAEELQRTGSMNIVAALGNIDPSFNIVTNNDMGSNPNVLPEIEMRGAGSFTDMADRYTTSPNQPLFIVDGFEASLSKVIDMDMNRVESITVLKDATAKAIYGSKGANGVVVVTTKAPEVGKLKVSYRADLNIQAPALGDYNRANAAEKLEIERLAGVYVDDLDWNPYDNIRYSKRYAAIQNEILRGVDTDWLSIPTRVGVGQKHSAVIEGGDQIFRYDVNLSYNDIQGVMKGSTRNTFEGGINMQYKYKNLLFKNQLSIIDNVGKESSYGSFRDYAMLNPYWRPYDEEGNVSELLGEYYPGATSYYGTQVNPMINAESNYKDESRYTDITNNFYGRQ